MKEEEPGVKEEEKDETEVKDRRLRRLQGRETAYDSDEEERYSIVVQRSRANHYAGYRVRNSI